MSERADAVVIGAGIVGLATAHRLLEMRPGSRVVVLEKESHEAMHQSGRNSGVLHSGIYYAPGSEKAVNCREGKALMEAFCEREELPWERCGKVIVALEQTELPRLDALEERARLNGVACERLGPEGLREREPHAAGVAALHVPEAGIADFRAVCARLVKRIREAGGEVLFEAEVRALFGGAEAVVVEHSQGTLRADRLVNCAGLHNDRVAALAGAEPEGRVVPFRGEYFLLRKDAHELCRNLIYPVPDPAFPFLGVHFTRRVDGRIECGPNAVLALAREGYRWSQISPRDLAGTLGYRGFWKLAAQHWRTGLGEVRRSLSRKAFTQALARLVPDLRSEHLQRAPAGVRAQLLLPDGSLEDDFRLLEQGRMVHLLNAPSPAATSAFAIAGRIAAKVWEPRG